MTVYFYINFGLEKFCINVYNYIKLYIKVNVMRTNIVIDDKLMNEAIKLSQLKTKRAVVESGLRLLIQTKKQERIKNLRGKLKWDGDLEKMRLDQ
jgi:Arc/MetJ family transcription regulator